MKIIRISLAIWLIVAGAVALGLYQVKYQVQHLEEELSQVRQDITDDRGALHVLEAEWSYLNRPGRLQHLARTYLEMRPATTTQVAMVGQIPPRITRTAPTPAELAEWPTMDGVPVPQSRPWSLEPRYVHRPGQIAQSGPSSNGTTSSPAASDLGTAQRVAAGQHNDSPAEPRQTQEARATRTVSAEARTISVGPIKINLGGRR